MDLPKRVQELPVGHDEPRRPTRSLPSYKEPTPETRRKLTREDEAEIALKRTVFTPGTAHLLIAFFLLTITIVPAIELVTELRHTPRGQLPPMLQTFRAILPTIRGLPRAEEIKAAEKSLETDSVVSQTLLPHVQSILTGKLGAGNEQVYVGRDGWLFYRPDVDYVTGPGFLTPAQMRHRAQTAGVQADPVKAIVHFRDQLAARGIELLVIPAPSKASLEGDKLSDSVRQSAPLQNFSFAEFKSRLEAAGVRMFDPAPLIMARKADTPLYLRTDTHWRAETMELVAREVAQSLQLERTSDFDVVEQEVSAIGDLARMLRLPSPSPESANIRQITSGNGLWRPSGEADVLVLGDSFANIFSLGALGWGESAGFVEHLSASLGRPLDYILRNSDGAFASREILARELARGRDRLAGKKLVIWEFAARELAFGDWKMIELKLGQAPPARFFSPPPGEVVEVRGTVESISAAPRPGTVPYDDHIIAVQVGEIEVPTRPGERVQAIVYLESMRDNVWTPAARLRPGDLVELRLRAWSDVAAEYEQINRTEIDNPELQLEEPSWGELL
ncbi:MAG TPA: hypothetical protein VG095_06640 [Chthoniobacterales bacterium]|nr:hypothetical protein [Chthoniobacterales bacterium]